VNVYDFKGITTIRPKFVSPISVFIEQIVSVKGNHGLFSSEGCRGDKVKTARSGAAVLTAQLLNRKTCAQSEPAISILPAWPGAIWGDRSNALTQKNALIP
jgi:hypothetical protein